MLRAARRRAGYTRTQLAAHLDVSNDTLGRYERGNGRMSADTLIIVCRLLNVAPSDLFEVVEVSAT